MKKKFILILASIFFTVVLCEVLLRFLGIGYNHNPMVTSKTRHHMNVNNYFFTSYSHHNEWKNFNIYYDKDGYRTKPGKKLNSRFTDIAVY